MDFQQIELANYSLDGLRTLSAEVDERIRHVELQAIQEARRRIMEIAQSTGLSVKELVATKAKIRTTKHVYVNPDNEQQSWNGLGRKPGWIKPWLDNGITLDELRSKDGV